MPRRSYKLMPALAVLAILGAPGSAVAQVIIGCEDPWPYVFILLDTSASMNRSAGCTQAMFDAGECGFVCTSGKCSPPLQADHPGSKMYQTRQALIEVLSGLDTAQLGWASMNQDTLSVRAKHWLYRATSAGPSISGWGPYPSVGSQETFGLVWSCGSGTGDSGVGCSGSAPADLPDAWEVTRVQRLPKGGIAFGDTVQVYVRNSSQIYRVTYQPISGGALGGPLQTTVTTVRCATSACTSTSLVGSQAVTWEPVGDFLSWDEAASAPSRTDPQTWFPQSQAADVLANNTCSGWDPNTDASADPANGYNLRQPTDSSDSRGTFFTLGDVIPLDWLNNHRDDILARLAPNLAVDPFATPDVRTSTYLQDVRQPGEAFLRLKDEAARPLVAAGSSPVGNAVRAFRTWYARCPGCSGPGWVDTAQAEDQMWGCREKYLLVISDGADAACTGPNPNADAAALYSLYGVRTWVMAVGVPINQDATLAGLAQNGHGQILYSQSRQELVDNLNSFFLSIQP